MLRVKWSKNVISELKEHINGETGKTTTTKKENKQTTQMKIKRDGA